jgi:hypothetical protein
LATLEPRGTLRQTLIVAGASFAAWTLFGLVSSVQFFFTEGLSGAPAYASLALHISVFYWVWAALTPALGRFMQTVERLPPPHRWIAIGAGALVIVVAHGTVYVLAMRATDGRPFLTALNDYFRRHTGGDVATYGVLSGIYLLYSATRRAREGEVAASHLRAQLAQADLELLRWQLQPHFLFNALGTVATLVRKQNHEAADRAVVLISRFLRAVLAHRPNAKVTLRDELEMVDSYVAIEGIRFRRGLRIERDVPEDLANALVPSLLLQPIVENAIHHGLKRAGDVGTVRVAALSSGRELEIEVSNNGDPTPVLVERQPPGSEGFGLRYVRERLAHFYGERGSMLLRISTFGSATSIRLPLEFGACIRAPSVRGAGPDGVRAT